MAEIRSRFSLSISTAIADALAKEAHSQNMDFGDIVELILEKHALAGTFLHPDEKADIEMYRSLIQRVINAASHIVSERGFRDSITADAIEACMSDAKWRSDYTIYIGDDPYKNGNPRKQNINPSFGYWVKKTLGAKSKIKDGKTENRKILGSIIQSYTPLEL